MRLLRLRFKHLKGFAACTTSADGFFEIDFNEQSTIFIGKNGSGKSTILEALAFLNYGYDENFTRSCHEHLRFPPYAAATELQLSLKHNGSTYDLSYVAEEHATLTRKARPNDAIDTDANCEISHRLVLQSLVIDGAPFNYTVSISTFAFSFSSRDIADFGPELNAKLACILDLHTNCWLTFFSPLKVDEFTSDKGRYILSFPTLQQVTYSASGKDEARRVLETHFELDLFWDTLPNEGTVSATNIRNRNSDVLYPISREASGFTWLMQVLLGACNRKDHFILIDEPESFLHPSYQVSLRRALADTSCQVIAATHSAAIIDQTLNLPSTVYRVRECSDIRTIERVSKHLFHSGILDDLGIRPSQILQTNGIVWVEGITDRIYVNKWIDLYCAQHQRQRPIEGVHYSILEYGGRCLSHLSFNELTKNDLESSDLLMLIPILHNNPNNFVIMDSDKKDQCDELNSTKSRIVDEIGADAVWITWGKEIENYLSPELIGLPLNRFDAISEKYQAVTGTVFNKAKFARAVASRITSENWLMDHDLEMAMERLVDRIFNWADLS